MPSVGLLPRMLILLACSPLVLPLEVAGKQPADIDPVVASPESFTVLLENEHVRVVEYVLAPGERDDWHTHPPKVSYVVAAGTLPITTEDGRSFLSEEEAGTASWKGSLGKHFAENVGETPVRVLLVEVKAARPGPAEATH